MRSLVIGFLLLLFAGIMAGVWQVTTFLTSSPSSAPGEERVFEVHPGEGFNKVAHRLEGDGLIRNAMMFKVLSRVMGLSQGLRVGEYAVRTDMRPADILKVLSSGRSIERQVTFPEGWNLYEMAQSIEDKGVGSRDEFIKLVKNPSLVRELLNEDLPSLEGYLFPETYMYTKYTPLETIVRNMVGRFKQVFQEVTGGANSSLTRHQLVTLASVVEKETGAPEERPMIASVFHNRLEKGMRLQSDPTILYGILAETGVMKENITRQDILRPTPYNTYAVNGIPAGPIANPGREAMAAVLRPAESRYFYFVSRNDGTHVFSENLEDHNSAVRKFQLDQKAREGKSWRDLQKRQGARGTQSRPGP